ncbi:MAG: hypothetical protein ACJ0BN_08105 [Limisphaerales bacterium]|jgi:hypothetical protein|nr:hypothetical protein [Pedosphaera sp.]RZO73367.1 MAG: hypothetical protein EVA71_02845 [Limisphaerales bacterium]HBP57057.1 hypothetical protein [Verrucomicrobiales bacterium]HCP39640.1 hypothetical protein [Verrucomicrobiales bacterium]HCZ03334.1 hypothetical protein [Verrucomicrobiales bacterium]|tara:strand:- start:1955 stop:2194 length:240 start_codon:yes stop_codon:yes gene_type:complete
MDNQANAPCSKIKDLTQLEALLRQFGCPPDKTDVLASQLDKRAHQLASVKGKSYEASLMHLLSLMRQGWAAKDKGISTP